MSDERNESETPWACDFDGEPIPLGHEVFLDGPPIPGGPLPQVRCHEHAASDNGHRSPGEVVYDLTSPAGDESDPPTGAPMDQAEAHRVLVVSAEVGPNAAVRVKAAAALLGCSDRRVRDFIAEGRLESIPGKPLRVTRASVDALIADRAERGVTASTDIATPGPPTGTPSGDMRQVLEAVAMLAAQVSDLRAQLEARPAIEAEPKRWGIFARRNRATVPTNDATAAVDSLRQHYTAEQIRAALGDPSGDT